ncbi:energy transducer TonB [Hymenobacter sp. HD11105]
MPQYPGGHKKMLQDIVQGLHYPASAKAAGVGGTVLIGFIIGPDGRMRDVQLEQSLKAEAKQQKAVGELHEAALQAVRSLTAQWQPGRQNNKRVAVAFTIPLLLQP